MPEIHDRSFGARTTLRVGGSADRMIEVETLEELSALAATLGESEEVYVLGRGSNTLVSDAGFRGTVLHLGEGFGAISFDHDGDHCVVTAGASVDLPVLARRCVDQGLSGFTWAVGVPGTVGGALRMNAGGHGSDMSASVISAKVFSLSTRELVTLDRGDLNFSYRHSSLGNRDVVLEVSLLLDRGDQELEREALSSIVQWRRANQPGGSNCGSVFTNPEGLTAGALIDRAGLKGKRYGTAEISPKHANFIQADQGGRADDVAYLMREIVEAVEANSGIRLQSEVRMVGFGGTEQ